MKSFTTVVENDVDEIDLDSIVAKQIVDLKARIGIAKNLLINKIFFSLFNQFYSLKSKNIRYDKLFLVSSLEDKARVIVEEGIMIFFDDQPECLKDMPSNRNIMLVRNEGNFDFDDKKWLMSDITGKII